MRLITMNQLVPVLQIAVGPVILISGVGLLLLTMTNRLGRAVDRARILAQEFRKANGTEKAAINDQIEMLFRRAKLIRLAIVLSGVCVLLVSVLIITLFVEALFEIETANYIAWIFTASILSLVGSLVAFIWDVNLALEALRIELQRNSNGH